MYRVLDALQRFAVAVLDFFVGESGIETGWPCLWCSPVTHAVRDFIANGGGVDGWRFRLEHGGGIVGAIAAKFHVDPESIVIHAPGEWCSRQLIGDCDICLAVVDVDPITNRCPIDAHFVANLRAKPRPHSALVAEIKSREVITGNSHAKDER